MITEVTLTVNGLPLAGGSERDTIAEEIADVLGLDPDSGVKVTASHIAAHFADDPMEPDDLSDVFDDLMRLLYDLQTRGLIA